jgi:hypothetical protein
MLIRVMKSLLVLAILGAGLLMVTPANGCPFCVDQRGPTLVGDFNQATMVLLGTFVNAKAGAGGGLEGGTTDFVIEKVLKDHRIRNGKMKITLPRFLPNQKNKFVIFCDVFKDLIDPYRGEEVMANSDLVQYLQGALKVKDRPLAERLRYCFDYLNSSDYAVSIDAYREFAKANYEDYKDMGAKLPADTLAEWLQDSTTAAFRYGLYGSLLGLCGKEKHANLLHDLLKDQKVRKSSGVDGVLVGYITILAKEGKKDAALKYLKDLLDNPREEFLMQYAVLRTLRFFRSTRPDVFTQKQIEDTVVATLRHPSIADFGIEDLRRWKSWKMCDEVLNLMKKDSHKKVRIVRRAVLRYALQCPTKQCQDFVREQERIDPEWVNETRQLLELENSTPTDTK